MLTVGILLPGSTLYPSIGMDFLQGIKSCFKYNNLSETVFKIELIGFGLKEDELYKIVEKFLIIDNADVVIAYIGDHHATRLNPLFASAGKLLLIANNGADYPLSVSSGMSHTIFNSLNDNLCCFLTGKYAAKSSGKKEAIFATSFFDGGYRHTHAMSNAFVQNGGEVKFNFVSHYKKEEFKTDTLQNFIEDNPEIEKMLAIFSGDAARFFYKNFENSDTNSYIKWFCSPMMFDITAGDFDEPKPKIPDNLQGYTFWFPDLENEGNQLFKQYYTTEYSKDVNLFSMHGWECALLAMAFIQQRNVSADVESSINEFFGKKIHGPRGDIYLDKERYILAPLYLINASGNIEITLKETLTEIADAWHEMKAQISDEIYTSWLNTYLCI